MALSQLEQREVFEVLERYGLAPRERDVYLALLRAGRTTITPLARLARLPVTTAQSILNRLVERGLVGVSKRASRTVYEPLDPVILRRLLERRIEDVAAIIPLLRSLKADTRGASRVRVVARDAINDALLESLACHERIVHEIVAAGPFQEVIGERLHYTRRRVAAGVRLRSLRVEAHEIKRYAKATHVRELREAKFLPAELTFAWSVFFWDNTVMLIAPPDEGFACIIESASLRGTVAQLFELLWSVSRRMETADM